jgi:phosphoribosylformimino-5-aminoimidazole carboxamide ribotide isomerase
MTNSSFQVIPVLDLKGGRAVHAVAGQRAYYQPVRSILHATSDPLELGRALREALGLQSLYLADLDAIAGDTPDLALYEHLISIGFRLLVDAGLRDLRSARQLLSLDRASSALVAGLETLGGPHALSEIIGELGSERTIFSLDLFNGRPRIALPGVWKSVDPLKLVHEAVEQGARHLLLLDLARVGTGRGLGTLSLIARIRACHPEVHVSAGGGISGIAEVLKLKGSGASAALVGSAFHDGRIGRRELACLRG